MKAISRRLTIGAGRPNGSWLILLLLLAVLVPSVCLLWFMNKAVLNERLVVHQKLADAYQGTLRVVHDKLQLDWDQAATTLGTGPGPYRSSMRFAKLVQEGFADAAICFDARGNVVYPSSVSAPMPEAPGAAWVEAERLESSNPAAAAESFARLGEQTTDDYLKARALQGQARCLAKAGKKDQAIGLLTGPLEEKRFQRATDALGRLIVPNAELMAVELLKDSSPGRARAAFDRLRANLLDYDNPALSAPQRRFLMREAQRLVPDPLLSQMLAAEDLAARCLDAGPLRPGEAVLRPTALPGVWQFSSPRAQAVALYETDTILARMQASLGGLALARDVSVTFLPPGKDFERFFLNQPAGERLPGWRLALSLDGQRLFDTVAEHRIASYVWIGILVFATVIVLAALAMRLVRRQMALTQLRNDLVANVTHELKTPLSSMRLLVETLLNSQPLHEQTAREYLQLIAQENLRLSRLIDNFLTFSRMERNKYAFGFKEVPAAEIAEGAITAVRERFNVPGCQFKTQLDPDLPAVEADADAMVTAVVNLLDNAYKYSGEEKQITLSAHAENGSVCFAVKDNGIGLSPRDTRRIFKRFFQVDQRLSRTGGGCGLGLSIVKFIVTAHHGTVRVESQPGRGSTFIISLPGVAARPDQEQEPSPSIT